MQTIKLTEPQEKSLAEIEYLRNSMYGNLDFNATLDYMNRRYVEPISKLVDISESSLADCAAGFGFLLLSYLLEALSESAVIRSGSG
ncbi:MAG: hypothetical protein IPL00_20860 [Gammaproteobacteria bacterium]|nr:hypothetical protein [Gammaproteobacteria bacterium]